MTAVQTASAPLGRVFLSLIFIVSGLGKITAYAGTQAYMESAGVPGLLLPVVIALEVLGGLAIMLGWKTRVAAFLLAGFTLLSALLFHADFGDPMQQIMFLKNLALAGGFLLLLSHGPGPWSLDNREVA
jgi:putative oxidoreductase